MVQSYSYGCGEEFYSDIIEARDHKARATYYEAMRGLGNHGGHQEHGDNQQLIRAFLEEIMASCSFLAEDAMTDSNSCLISRITSSFMVNSRDEDAPDIFDSVKVIIIKQFKI